MKLGQLYGYTDVVHIPGAVSVHIVIVNELGPNFSVYAPLILPVYMDIIICTWQEEATSDHIPWQRGRVGQDAQVG